MHQQLLQMTCTRDEKGHSLVGLQRLRYHAHYRHNQPGETCILWESLHTSWLLLELNAAD